jgi:diguanylate cyclase (GGDEF)-like protein
MINSLEKYSKIKCIHTSKNNTVYSAFEESTGATVALKTATPQIVDLFGYAKIQNEYCILSKIRSEFVPKAIDFSKISNDYFIVLEYCDGITLLDYIKKHKISIKEFLYIAQQIVRALLDIHNAGIIHNDINPINIIYESTTRKISIIGFGLATEFSHEKSLSIEPNVSEGALYYISPEKTGRMNHTIDFRSDFYSLGITFFEMLCGAHPFESDSPTQLIYKHLAKMPPVIQEINSDVPEMISRILYKLMAKMPEDRYSKAEGILFDLNKCLETLSANNEIAEFELGTRDFSDHLEIPQKLYGRENEIAVLINAYREILKGGKSLVTIAGHSGIGKTSLVGELHKPIAHSNGIFISGKFEQYNRNVPYNAISQAIGQFCDFILSENENKIGGWKRRIAHVLQQDGQLLVDRIPRLALITGKLQNLAELSPLEERTRFKALLQDLLAIMASPSQPLVIFIDDIHLADIGSLEIIEEIMSNDKISGLLIVTCHRDNEVDDNHPLILSHNRLISHKANIQKISLYGLALPSAAQILTDTLHCNADTAAELGAVIYSKTGGNPFYIKQFLKHCYIKEYLFLDKTVNKWNWNIESIKACPAEENVVDFLIKNIDQIPIETKRLLSLGACIGQTFKVDTLSAIFGVEFEQILLDFKQAVLLEIVYPLKNKIGMPGETEFHFSHDRFQQTFYTILSEIKKNNIHYALAMHYEKMGFGAGDNAEKLFVMAENYSKAFNIIVEETEKRRVSEILLRTARVLSLNSAFDTAIYYLEQIINGLPELDVDNDFAFLVYCEYHSALCSLAKYAEADKAYVLLENIVREPIRLTDNCCLQAVSLSNRGKYKDAFMLGVELLEKLGVHFPAEDLLKTISKELELFYYEINKDGFPGIEGLPKANNILEFSIAKLLNRICTAGLFYNPLYLFWALITNAKRVLEKGYTPDGLSLYGSLTLLLIPFRNDYKLSYNLVSGAMRLAEKNGYRMFRMYHLFSLINCHWNEELKNSIPYARESCKGNISVGDFEFACFTYFTTQQVVLETCENIEELITDSDSALAFAEKHGNIHAYGSFICFRQLCKSLINRGLSEGSFNDDNFNEATHLGEISTNRMALSFFYTLRALSAVIFLDFEKAFELTEKAAPLMPSITGFYLTSLHNFLSSLSICKRIESKKCTDEEKTALFSKLSTNQIWLKERATDAPGNYKHLFDLIEAERYMLEHNNSESFTEYKKMLSLYEEAMLGASDSNRIYHYALACELAGIQFMKSGSLRTATVYLKEAFSAYSSWGAAAKAEQMSEKYNDLERLRFNSLKFRENRVFTNTQPALFSAFSSAVDFAAIITASQAISGETKLEAILEKLIRVLLENSGAQDIYYLVKKDNNYFIQAEGHSEVEAVSILHGRPVEASDFPMKILNYVERTYESIIINAATASEMYGNDDYILSHRCKSVMCMPVINKGVLNGMLYLENNLIEGVFDKQRIEALKIIAVQLAISLENSYLFDNLQQLVDEKTSELREEITIRKNAEERLQQMANYDFLTKLPNRRMFQTYLDHSIKLAVRNKTNLAVLFIDLDGFKRINDQFGHDKGDAVLIATAERLTKTIRSGDTVSRMGGDEFLIILENIKAITEIEKVCSRIIEFIQKPIELDGLDKKVIVTSSIGISLLYFDGNTSEELISNSDKAMYLAKNSGKNRYAFHSKQYGLP